MDELASTLGDPKLGWRNPGYKDLAKLYKLACADLGIKSDGKVQDDKSKTKPKQDNPKKRIEMGGSRKNDTEPRKITSMKDAYEKAKEDLANR
jgi:hypothetical protein